MKRKIAQLKISVVCPWFFWGDAVGRSAHDYYRALRKIGYENTRAIGTRTDFPDMEFELCEDFVRLERNRWFIDSDIVIYHFAIYHEYFEILRKPNKKGRHVICFHNVTPKHLMPADTWEIIDKSFAQISVFKHADAIWADSRENLDELKRNGMSHMPILEMPIAVDRPKLTNFWEKSRRQIELLYVGRFFSSKGIHDIIDALAMLKQRVRHRFVLRLVGNTDFSDHAYVRDVQSRIRLHGLGEYVDFIGKVDDSTLARLFRQSHIFVSASYHEGFCVPVIESLRAGMIPVTYLAGNLRWIAGGHGRTVETGNIDALALALVDVINGVANALMDPEEPFLPLDSGMQTAHEFSAAAKQYACDFSFSKFAERVDRAVSDLITGS